MITTTTKVPNVDPQKSAQPCGCDEGASWTCQWHSIQSMTPNVMQVMLDRKTMREMILDGRGELPVMEKVTFKVALNGIGGAPTRATTFPEDPIGRKQRPVASGVLDYFPDALVAVAEVSWAGNEQHNPGQDLHWNRGKSSDEADALIRHFLQRGSKDTDGLRHSAKLAWRALALLQKEVENG